MGYIYCRVGYVWVVGEGIGGGLVGSSGLGAKLVEYKWLSGWVITSAY